MKKCEFCAEEIQDEAIKCKHCGSMLNGESSITEQVLDEPKESMPAVKSKLFPRLSMLPGESVRFETRPSLAPLAWTAIGWGLLGAFFFPVNPAITYWTLGIVGIIAFFQYCGISATAYIVTNKRVLQKKGIVADAMTQAPIDKIQNVAMKEVFGFLDIGHISFDTAGGPFKELVWMNIPSPRKAFKLISEVVHK